MRQLVVDQLRKDEVERVKEYLDRHAEAGPLPGIYRLSLPEDLLAEEQWRHNDCRPFHFAIELGEDFVNFELLVRTANRLHCPCMAYATSSQRQFLLTFADRLLGEQNIKS